MSRAHAPNGLLVDPIYAKMRCKFEPCPSPAPRYVARPGPQPDFTAAGSNQPLTAQVSVQGTPVTLTATPTQRNGGAMMPRITAVMAPRRGWRQAVPSGFDVTQPLYTLEVHRDPAGSRLLVEICGVPEANQAETLVYLPLMKFNRPPAMPLPAGYVQVGEFVRAPPLVESVAPLVFDGDVSIEMYAAQAAVFTTHAVNFWTEVPQ